MTDLMIGWIINNCKIWKSSLRCLVLVVVSSDNTSFHWLLFDLILDEELRVGLTEAWLIQHTRLIYVVILLNCMGSSNDRVIGDFTRSDLLDHLSTTFILFNLRDAQMCLVAFESLLAGARYVRGLICVRHADTAMLIRKLFNAHHGGGWSLVSLNLILLDLGWAALEVIRNHIQVFTWLVKHRQLLS